MIFEMTTGWALMTGPPLDMVRPTLPERGRAAPRRVASKGCAVIAEHRAVPESRQNFFVVSFIRFHRMDPSPMIGVGMGKSLAEMIRENQGSDTTSRTEDKGKWSVVGACFVHVGSSDSLFFNAAFWDAVLLNRFPSDGVLFDVECVVVVEVSGFDRPSRKYPFSSERSWREWIRTSLCQAQACHSRTSENDSLAVRPLRSRPSILKSGFATTSEIAETFLTARSVGCVAAKFLVLSRTNRGLLIPLPFRPSRRKVMGDEKSRIVACSSEDAIPSPTFPSRPPNLNTNTAPCSSRPRWVRQRVIERSNHYLPGQVRERASRTTVEHWCGNGIRQLARGKMREDPS